MASLGALHYQTKDNATARRISRWHQEWVGRSDYISETWHLPSNLGVDRRLRSAGEGLPLSLLGQLTARLAQQYALDGEARPRRKLVERYRALFRKISACARSKGI